MLWLQIAAVPAATITWINTSGGAWQTAANWSPAQVPVSADTVLITTPGTYTITLANNVTVSQLTLGAASGSQTLSLANQTLDTTTAGIILGNGVLQMSGGALKGNMTIETGGLLTFTGNAQKALYQLNLVNKGTVRWQGGNLAMGATPTTLITNGGLWEINGDDNLYQGVGGPTPEFVNNGTIRKATGTGASLFSSMKFENAGLIETLTGTIQFNGAVGTLLGGTFTTGAGATIQLASGTFTENGGVFNGGGTARMTGGTLTLVNNKLNGLSLNGGEIKLGPAFQATGAITDLALNGAELIGTNEISGTLTVLAGGPKGGRLTVRPGGIMIFSSTAPKNLYQVTLINHGTVRWLGGNIVMGSTPTTVITNAGLWEISGDDTLYQGTGGPTPQFVNPGIVRKITGVGSTLFSSMTFGNSGLVEALSGTIQFNGSVETVLDGTFTAGPGAAIQFASGTLIGGNAVFNGGGNLRMTGGTLTLLTDKLTGLSLNGGDIKLGPAFQAAGAITDLTLNGATLTGTNEVAGTLTFLAGGTQGRLTVRPSGTVLFSGGTQKTLYQTSFINNGTVRWLGGNIALGSTPTTTFSNAGLLEISGDNSFYQGIGGPTPQLSNTGTMRKIAGTGAALFSSLTFSNTGLVLAQSGTIQFNSSVASVLGGKFTSEAGASVVLASGTFLEDGGVFDGEGTRRLNGGTLSLVNNILTGLTLGGGDIKIEPTFQAAGAITNLTLSGSTLVGTNEIAGTLILLGGGTEGKVTVRPGATINVTGATQKTLYRTSLINNGTVRWLGGNIALGSTPTSLIANAGLWEIHGDDTIFQGIGGPTPQFVNTGTLRKAAGVGNTIFSSLMLENSGLVEALSGTIQFNAMVGSIIGGSFSAVEGAGIQFGSGTFTENGGVFTGGGTLRMTGGTLSLVHDKLNGLSLNGGDVRVGPDFQAAGAITNLALNGATLVGTNQVAGTLTVSAGGMEGEVTVRPGGVILFPSAAQKTLYRLVLKNNGTLRWLGGNLSLGATPTTRIENNALWEINGDDTAFQGVGGPTSQIINLGTVRKLGGAGATVFSNLAFDNRGAIEVQSGTIQFNAAVGSLLGGTVMAADGAVFQLTSGTYTENGGVFTGPGSLRMTGGTLSFVKDQMAGLSLNGGDVKVGETFQAAGAITNLTLNGATLTGTNEVAGTLTISAGGIEGRITVRPAGQILFTGNTQKTLYKLAFNNAGTVRWLGGNLSLGSTPPTVINNSGLWEIATDSSMFQGIGGADPQFINSGAVRKTIGVGLAPISNVNFNSSGLVEVQTGTLRLPNNYTHTTGILRLAGGRIETVGLLTVAGGTLEGTGSFGNSEFTGGIISPGVNGPGQISFPSGLKLGPAVKLRVDATGNTPGTGYDQLVVTGLVDLGNATLEVGAIGPVDIGTQLAIIENDGAEVAGSVFTNFDEGELFQVGTQLFRLRYRSGTGNDVALVRDDGGVRLTAIRMQPDGSFLFRGLGTNFGNYTISATEDYGKSWTELGTTKADSGGIFQFTDPDAQFYPLRYYRSFGPGVTLPLFVEPEAP